ncbi:MAG TPA: FAD-binding oxidoreductase [Candidatus Baltobacteraceae bacterium]|nr:FAD-binding oxidoreductase [Candidatus Baltobacteraceae bacterium]
MTIDTISDLLRTANENGECVLVEGGNTLRGMGRPPLRAEVTLSTLGLDAIVENAPADLTIAVQAGVTLRKLAHALAPHGTHVPFDAPRNAEATVGGTLAAGWIGPRRHLYGRPRDFVIGSVAVLADGTIARAGGMVVKNVSGYDMSRLYVGSFGTLAVFVQINLKTIAAPQTQRAFAMRLPEGTRERALDVLSHLDVTPAAAFWIDGFRGTIDGDDGQEGRMLVLLEGSATSIERLTREVRSALGRAGVPETRVIDAGARESFERVLDAYVASVGERSITYRIPVFPDEALACARDLTTLAARFELRHDAIVDAMNGDVIFRVNDLDAMALATKIEMFDDALHDMQPGAIVIAGNHPHRPMLAVWGSQPNAIEPMRALKARFDPKNTLNPGRFVAGI